MHGLSAHADQGELLRWLGEFQRPPAACYLVHGEPEAAAALAKRIDEDLDWPVRPAIDGEVVEVLRNEEWPG